MNKMNKDYQDFSRQLAKSNVKYIDIIANNQFFKEALYEEFVRTEQSPDYYLYSSSFFSEKQIKDGFEAIRGITTNVNSEEKNIINIERELNKISLCFYEKLQKKELSMNFFSFKVDNTTTVKILNSIDNKLTSFKKIVLVEATNLNIDKEAEAFAHSINILLNKLKNPALSKAISNAILDDDKNIDLDIELIFNKGDEKIKELYERLKVHFDLHLLSLQSPVDQKEFGIKSIPTYNSNQEIVHYDIKENMVDEIIDKNIINKDLLSNSDIPSQSKDIHSIALMYVYLDMAGYFPRKVPLKRQMADNEYYKYKEKQISFNSLYNKFMAYRAKSIKPTVEITSKTIKWLEDMGALYDTMRLEKALNYAKVELNSLNQLNSQPRL